jgi:predicted nuclease of restriction endonuclease-like (RecB) superfamily
MSHENDAQEEEDGADSVEEIGVTLSLGTEVASTTDVIPASVVPVPVVDEAQLLADVRGLIVAARGRVALYVNQETTLLYWDVGARVRRDVLGFERAAYGQRIVENLARELTHEFGRGYSRANLFSMLDFAATFPERTIVQTLSGQLSWSHFIELLRVEDLLARAFYTELTRLHRWGVRLLRDKIRSRLYDRSLLSRKPEELIARELEALRDEDRLSVDMVLRDPYLLSALGLGDTYSEQELEDAILREMEAFLLEIGDGFAFVARQRKFPSPASGGRVRELDLLFYHRKLRRLVAIELKVGPFEPEFKGQMEYYLRWLNENERETGEEAPIGMILCSEAHPEDVSLMGLDQGDIRVVRYITENLPPPLLEKKLREIITRHREFRARKAARDRKEGE